MESYFNNTITHGQMTINKYNIIYTAYFKFVLCTEKVMNSLKICSK